MSESGSGTRHFTSWIDGFLEYTSHVPSPEIFRLWSGLATIAGAMERKTWALFSEHRLYPNMFTLLVSPPGVGKSMAIKECYEFWSAANLPLAPTSVTHKGLLTEMVKANPLRITKKDVIRSHSMLVASSEFGNLVPAHDLAFLNTLNNIWDCPKIHNDVTKTGGEVRLEEPCLNIIAGTQPKYLGATFPEAAFGMGFMSRIVLVFSNHPVALTLFGDDEEGEKRFARTAALAQKLKDDLNQIKNLSGRYRVTKGMAEAFQDWVNKGMPPVPKHVKLEHYLPRRHMHVMKLAMVLSAARDNDLIVGPEDFEQARKILLMTEASMPTVFAMMANAEDADVVEEVFQHVLKHQPLKGSEIYSFLMSKMPQQKVKWTFDNMRASGLIEVHNPTGLPAIPGAELSSMYVAGKGMARG